MSHGTYETVDGRPALRFERVYPHPPAAVWSVVTEPDELAHWFPAVVTVDDLRPGGAIRFVFPDPELPPGDGEVLQVEPERRLAFTWGEEELRFELSPHDDGCRLVFTHLLSAAEQAANNAAGWDVCLAKLEERLDGGHPEPPGTTMTPELRELYQGYVERGLPSGAPLPGDA